MSTWELEVMRDHLRDALSRVTALLIQNLTQRDRLLVEREKNYDVITAILQAASPKRILKEITSTGSVCAMTCVPANSRLCQENK
ncbi:hypothetical protein DAPPUDRAFT_248782 [Daphnia pulex]|uniref:Uncharacterized protein n=1 Tax=Daphnia pulex TaxID=6669 RepID=E9GV73_DAPPU|nr:hypothetical protein DAPPUDRAFT_248782 [Daphnia pulex]|eukprot:EFX76612.1 hypothetical protein DAPPUDRAFT_248782 [Daphnia pulex]